jgi:hypothetical protein
MRKVVMLLAIFVLILLASLLAGAETAKAAYTPDGAGCPFASGINIASPSNSTYSSSLLLLNITIRSFLSPTIYRYVMTYSVDGESNATIPVTAKFVPVEATLTYPNGTTTTAPAIIGSYYAISGCVALPKLPEGAHNVTVYGRYERINDTNNGWLALILDNSTVCFTISDGVSPVVGSLSLENRTYSQGNLTLSFTTDQPTSWVGYCLDGNANVTVAGNVTLTGVADGTHNITVYAADLAGNIGASENLYFSVEVPKPFPTMLVAASTLSVAVVSAGLLVYFKKRGK